MKQPRTTCNKIEKIHNIIKIHNESTSECSSCGECNACIEINKILEKFTTEKHTSLLYRAVQEFDKELDEYVDTDENGSLCRIKAMQLANKLMTFCKISLREETTKHKPKNKTDFP